MKEFVFDKGVYQQICQQAEAEYPSESCGWVIKQADGSQVYHPAENLQDKYHKLDPEAYPRTSKEAFLMNTLKLTRSIDEAVAAGGSLYSIVHSHIDVGAYFSAEDKHQMSRDDEEVYPSENYLVVAVKEKKIDANAVFYYDQQKKDFIEAKVVFD